MIQMDIPAAFGFSQLFAWCGRRWLQREQPSLTSSYNLLAVTYALAVIGPCALYLYGGWPEWETMYWFEPIHMDTANFGNLMIAGAAPVFLLLLAISAAVGFTLAHHWIRSGKPRRALLGCCIGLALSILVILPTPSAPMFVGPMHDYRAYLHDALTSGNPSDYGIILVGPLAFGIPWLARPELLASHHLLSCFERSFFVPLLLDSFVYFGLTAVLALWFYRHQPVSSVNFPGFTPGPRHKSQEESEVEDDHHPGPLSEGREAKVRSR